MSNLVRKNTLHPKSSLYHHSLIKLLILDHIKERNKTWETFLFKVLNLHINICKRSFHLHHGATQTPPVEEENPNIIHLDEDTSEASPSAQNTPASPVSTKFVPLPRPHTKKQKAKNVQRMLYPIV